MRFGKRVQTIFCCQSFSINHNVLLPDLINNNKSTLTYGQTVVSTLLTRVCDEVNNFNDKGKFHLKTFYKSKNKNNTI